MWPGHKLGVIILGFSLNREFSDFKVHASCLGPTHREPAAIYLGRPRNVHFSQASVDTPLLVSQLHGAPEGIRSTVAVF